MADASIKQEYDSKYSGKTIKVCFDDNEGIADCYTGNYSGYENGKLLLSDPPNTVENHLIQKIDIVTSGGRRRKRKSARRRRSSRRGSRRYSRK